jgi:hypothetical protein
MKVSFRGIYSLDEFYQALFEEHKKFEELGIKHISRVQLYYTPVDEYGDPVVPRDPDTGEPLDGWKSNGAYHSAAHEYGL